jgi:hypothetical protein
MRHRVPREATPTRSVRDRATDEASPEAATSMRFATGAVREKTYFQPRSSPGTAPRRIDRLFAGQRAPPARVHAEIRAVEHPLACPGRSFLDDLDTQRRNRFAGLPIPAGCLSEPLFQRLPGTLYRLRDETGGAFTSVPRCPRVRSSPGGRLAVSTTIAAL